MLQIPTCQLVDQKVPGSSYFPSSLVFSFIIYSGRLAIVHFINATSINFVIKVTKICENWAMEN